MIPYLLIYEKENQLNLLTPSNNVSHQSEKEDPKVVTDDHDHEVDFQFHINSSQSVSNCESTSVSESKREKRKLQACLKELSSDNAYEPKIQKLSKTSVCKGYVICPNEDCNEHLVINSDEEVIDCKNCGTMSNINL